MEDGRVETGAGAVYSDREDELGGHHVSDNGVEGTSAPMPDCTRLLLGMLVSEDADMGKICWQRLAKLAPTWPTRSNSLRLSE